MELQNQQHQIESMFQAIQLKMNVFEKQLKNILSVDVIDYQGLID